MTAPPAPYLAVLRELDHLTQMAAPPSPGLPHLVGWTAFFPPGLVLLGSRITEPCLFTESHKRGLPFLLHGAPWRPETVVTAEVDFAEFRPAHCLHAMSATKVLSWRGEDVSQRPRRGCARTARARGCNRSGCVCAPLARARLQSQRGCARTARAGVREDGAGLHVCARMRIG